MQDEKIHEEALNLKVEGYSAKNWSKNQNQKHNEGNLNLD